MKIEVNGSMINLDDNDVQIAHKLVNSFLGQVKKKAINHNNLKMYITVAVAMHTASADVLNAFDSEILKAIVNKEEKSNG